MPSKFGGWTGGTALRAALWKGRLLTELDDGFLEGMLRKRDVYVLE